MHCCIATEWQIHVPHDYMCHMSTCTYMYIENNLLPFHSQTPTQQTGRVDYDNDPSRICPGGGFGPVSN